MEVVIVVAVHVAGDSTKLEASDRRALLAQALQVDTSALALMTPEETDTAFARFSAINEERTAAEDNTGIDQLTGTILGAAGHVVLQHAMNRATRIDEPLLLAMVVLEAHHEMPGSTTQLTMSKHAILDVARRLSATLRSYDAIVRYSSDELLCILDNAEIEDHSPRLDALVFELARHGYVVNIGLAQLQGGDTLEAFVSRSRTAAAR